MKRLNLSSNIIGETLGVNLHSPFSFCCFLEGFPSSFPIFSLSPPLFSFLYKEYENGDYRLS